MNKSGTKTLSAAKVDLAKFLHMVDSKKCDLIHESVKLILARKEATDDCNDIICVPHLNSLPYFSYESYVSLKV